MSTIKEKLQKLLTKNNLIAEATREYKSKSWASIRLSKTSYLNITYSEEFVMLNVVLDSTIHKDYLYKIVVSPANTVEWLPEPFDIRTYSIDRALELAFNPALMKSLSDKYYMGII